MCIRLAESSSEEMDSFDTLGCTIIEELQRRLSRNRYNNVIHFPGDQPEVRENLVVGDATAAGTNGVNDSRETSRTQVYHP